jgi:hypothetical protein
MAHNRNTGSNDGFDLGDARILDALAVLAAALLARSLAAPAPHVLR